MEKQSTEARVSTMNSHTLFRTTSFKIEDESDSSLSWRLPSVKEARSGDRDTWQILRRFQVDKRRVYLARASAGG
jgi:hypothetical protein